MGWSFAALRMTHRGEFMEEEHSGRLSFKCDRLASVNFSRYVILSAAKDQPRAMLSTYEQRHRG
jgi:hypothetical protein